MIAQEAEIAGLLKIVPDLLTLPAFTEMLPALEANRLPLPSWLHTFASRKIRPDIDDQHLFAIVLPDPLHKEQKMIVERELLPDGHDGVAVIERIYRESGLGDVLDIQDYDTLTHKLSQVTILQQARNTPGQVWLKVVQDFRGLESFSFLDLISPIWTPQPVYLRSYWLEDSAGVAPQEYLKSPYLFETAFQNEPKEIYS